MEKTTNFFMKHTAVIAEKFSKNRYLSSIKDTFLLLLPFTIFGSFFVAIANFPFLEKILSSKSLTEVKNYISPTFTFTMGIMALIVALGVGFNLSKHYQVKAIFGGILGLISYLIITPSTLTLENGRIVADILPIKDLGAYGMFSAIIISIISTEIYRLVIQKNITIKMPESVPQLVADSFSAFLPIAITLTFILVLRNLFLLTSFNTLNEFIYIVLQKPLIALGSSLPAMIIVGILINLFWFFGLHGHIIVLSVMFPVFSALSIESLEAFKAGKELPHIINGGFQDFFAINGGYVSIPIVICLTIFLKKNIALKKLGKIATAPALFGVYEPLIFGLPIMLNPILFIPFMLTPIITILLSYSAMSLGLVAWPTGAVFPYTMPLVISGFLATNSISGSILQIVILVILTFMWYIFLNVLSKKMLETELSKNK